MSILSLNDHQSRRSLTARYEREGPDDRDNALRSGADSGRGLRRGGVGLIFYEEGPRSFFRGPDLSLQAFTAKGNV